MHPFTLVATIEGWLYVGLAVVAVVLQLWAVVHCATRSSDQFAQAGLKQKSFWMILTALAAAFGVLMLPAALSLTAGFGLFQAAAMCVAAVYLAGPRSEMNLYGRGGSSPYSY